MRFVMGSAEGLGNSPLPANQAVPKCYGVTKPISMAGPCDTDVQRNKELEKVLIDKFWLPFSARFEISMVDFFFFFCLFGLWCISSWSTLACTKAKRNLPREKRFFPG